MRERGPSPELVSECLRIIEDAIRLCDQSGGEVGAYEAIATRMAIRIEEERGRVLWECER